LRAHGRLIEGGRGEQVLTGLIVLLTADTLHAARSSVGPSWDEWADLSRTRIPGQVDACADA